MKPQRQGTVPTTGPTVLRAIGTAVLVGAMLSVVASPILYRGWKHRQRYARIRETPVVTPRSAEDGQQVLLTGVARIDGERARAPVSDTDALVAAWDVCRWVTERLGSRRYWLPEARGVDVAGFVLDCDGHAVRVPAVTREETVDTLGDFFSVPGTDTGIDVAGVDVEVEDFETEVFLPPTDEPAGHLAELTGRLDLDSQPRRRELIPFTRAYGTRRFREATVAEGQQVTVRGVVRRPAAPGEDVTLQPPDDAPLLLSALSPAHLQRRYRWGYWKRFHLFLALIVVASLAVALL